jgi:RNA polymerase sigma-70 factor (ECF subfamily)
MPEKNDQQVKHDKEALHALVRRAAAGDHAAFGTLMASTQDTVYRVALRTVSVPSDAEEATQEAYVRAWKQLGSFAFQSSVVTWLCRIAINAAIDMTRKQTRRKEARPSEDNDMQAWIEQLPDDSLNPEEAMEWAHLQEHIQSILEGMKPDFRVVFALREIDGLSYEEIAEATGVPVGTVESRLHRARKMFWSKYKRQS